MEKIWGAFHSNIDGWCDAWIEQWKTKHGKSDETGEKMKQFIRSWSENHNLLNTVQTALNENKGLNIEHEQLTFEESTTLFTPIVELFIQKLPLGSVFTVKWDQELGARYNDMQFVVTGRFKQPKYDEMWYTDYQAVPYPFGMIEPNQYFYFNHEDVHTVIHEGLRSDIDTEYSIFIQSEYQMKMNMHKVRQAVDIKSKKSVGNRC